MPDHSCLKGYKQTEVGLIPEDWPVRRVGDICDFIVPGRNKPRLFDGEIPWVTTPDLEDGRSISTSRIGLCVSRAEAQAIGSRVVPVGSVLMSCAGDLGITAITRDEIVINQQLHAFIPSPKINAVFLLNVITSQKSQIESLATKTAVSYLNKNNCNSILIPLPTIAEQEAIAGVLSDADDLIASLEYLITKKRLIKQGAMQELLTGKKRLPGFSGKWKEKVFTDICNLVHGYQFRTNDFVNNPDGIKVIKIGNVLDGRFDTDQCDYINKDRISEFSAYLIQQGDVLMSLTGNIGRVVRVGFVSEPLLQNYRVGKFVPRGVDANYLTLCLASQNTTKQLEYFANQAAQANFGKQDFDKIRIEIPPTIKEQTAIATILSDMNAEIAALKAKLVKARNIKQGMMQELLTGRIRLV